MRWLCFLGLIALLGCSPKRNPSDGASGETRVEVVNEADGNVGGNEDSTGSEPAQDIGSGNDDGGGNDIGSRHDSIPAENMLEWTPKPTKETMVEPHPEVVAEPQPEITAEPQPEVTAEVQPEIMAEPQPEITAEPQPEVTAEPQPEVVAEPQPEIAMEPNPETSVDTGALTCSQRERKARGDLEKVRQNYLRCRSSQDCTTASMTTKCQGACPAAVNTTGRSKMKATVDAINNTYCATFRADGCSYSTPRCVNQSSLCHEGECKMLACGSRTKMASERIKKIQQQNLSCSSDSDCVLFWSGTKCRGACQSAINRTGEPLVKAAIKDINSTICDNYRQDGCPYATPGCLPSKAKCVSQECKVVSSTP